MSVTASLMIVLGIPTHDRGYEYGFNHTTERQHRGTLQAMYLYEMVVCNFLV
jgi:hypothetical protein